MNEAQLHLEMICATDDTGIKTKMLNEVTHQVTFNPEYADEFFQTLETLVISKDVADTFAQPVEEVASKGSFGNKLNVVIILGATAYVLHKTGGDTILKEKAQHFFKVGKKKYSELSS